MDTGTHTSETAIPGLQFTCVLNTSDFHKEWIRCSMLADYLAEYSAYQYLRREWAENLISTVANDCLEAVINLSPQQNELTLHCVQHSESLLLQITHGLRPEVVQAYRSFLAEASSENTDVLYFHLLTEEHTQPAFNQLGLMMLVHDFGARITAKFHEAGNSAVTQVLIPTKELSI